jgi:hypothetical protein
VSNAAVGTHQGFSTLLHFVVLLACTEAFTQLALKLLTLSCDLGAALSQASSIPSGHRTKKNSQKDAVAMSISALSTELDENILQRLAQLELDSISRASKDYRTLGEPLLYKSLTFS